MIFYFVQIELEHYMLYMHVGKVCICRLLEVLSSQQMLATANRLQITNSQITTKNCVRKSHICKVPHLRKVCKSIKSANLRFPELICGLQCCEIPWRLPSWTWVIGLNCKNSFCVLADVFQVFVSFSLPYTIINFSFASLKLLTEILLRIPFSVIVHCSMFYSADPLLAAEKMRQIYLSHAAWGLISLDHRQLPLYILKIATLGSSKRFTVRIFKRSNIFSKQLAKLWLWLFQNCKIIWAKAQVSNYCVL